jgi:hypothetical protein
VDEYDGTTAVTRSEHLDTDEIEYARWKAERWMKVRHMPSAFRHDPLWVTRTAPQLLAHTFRGTSWRSLLGLEDSRAVFRRYRDIRAGEREYLNVPDPLEGIASDHGSPAHGSTVTIPLVVQSSTRRAGPSAVDDASRAASV